MAAQIGPPRSGSEEHRQKILHQIRFLTVEVLSLNDSLHRVQVRQMELATEASRLKSAERKVADTLENRRSQVRSLRNEYLHYFGTVP